MARRRHLRYPKNRPIRLRTTGIGAYFAMLAIKNSEKALLVCPISDIVKLIYDAMAAEGVTPERLEREGETEAETGQLLSWAYLQHAVANPVNSRQCETKILHPEFDEMTSMETVKAFAAATPPK